MKIKIFTTLFLALSLSSIQAQDMNRYVNPMIGTVKMGHTFPGACAPFGIVQLSPETDTIPQNIDGHYQPKAYSYCAGYQHTDPTIVGFSHTHLSGTGHSDLGDILVMPQTGKLKLNPGTATHPEYGYRSRFSHDTEHARPGYYEVYLSDYGIKAQMTATHRVGVHKYTFPKNENQRIIIDLIQGIYNYDGKVLWASLQVKDDHTITGFRLTNGWAGENYTYFAISFSKPIINYGYVEKQKPKYNGFRGKFDIYHNFPEISGRKIVSYFEFEPSSSETLEIKVALSGVSQDGALANLHAETDNKNFDQLAKRTAQEWNKELSVIQVEGSEDQKDMFYTSLYHTMINPSVYMDVDGKYRGIDHNIHQADGFTNYTIFSLWDTHRAEHPLLNIIKPDRNKDMVKSMLHHFEQSPEHMLPVWSLMGNEGWCMIGYHAVSVLADAADKYKDLDLHKMLNAMYTTSNVNYYDDLGVYKKMGYVPFDVNGGGSSMTLEYAYDDWTIYKTALDAGDSVKAAVYKKRALNYRNVFNPSSHFIGARMKDGSWKKNFSLLNTDGEGFVEGNGWNYTFYVPHDVQGLIDLSGGDKQFISRLDQLFTMHLSDKFFEKTEDVTREGVLGGYVHGNEPSHHIIYLYNWTSQPWKAQYWLRETMDKMYKNSISGLCGNDDCGQMSAWYIFSAMGFYPVCPGSNQYVLGAPYLPSIKVNLENGKQIVIKAEHVSDKMRYVKAVYLNDKLYKKAYITYNDIKDGANLTFIMSDKPNKSRIFKKGDKPYSLSDEK